MRVPVVEFDGIDVDQGPLTEGLRVVEDGLNGVPVSDSDREHLRAAVQKAAPHCTDALERLFVTVDRGR